MLLALAGLLASFGPAAARAAAVSSHSQLHTCCTDSVAKDAIFREARDSGAAFIRLDVEMAGVFAPAPFGITMHDWSGVDEVAALSRRYRLPVDAVLLGSPVPAPGCPAAANERQRLCPPADPVAWGAQAAEIAARHPGQIDHLEIWNEPDGAWAFAGTPEDYGRMLAGSFDAIKAARAGARVVLGGTMYPTARGDAWLARALATPGTGAAQKFDVGSIHLRGRISGMVAQLRRRASLLRGLGRQVPMWVTEHGYSATPKWQRDPAYKGGEQVQARYLERSLPALARAGAQQTFVTLLDAGPGPYESEGIVAGHATAAESFRRRPAFGAVRRIAAEPAR